MSIPLLFLRQLQIDIEAKARLKLPDECLKTMFVAQTVFGHRLNQIMGDNAFATIPQNRFLRELHCLIVLTTLYTKFSAEQHVKVHLRVTDPICVSLVLTEG